MSEARVTTGIYVRVSTEEQAQEGFSIRAQMEKLKTYAMLKEWDIYDIYPDEGISGKNITERPQINRLIDDINSGKVNNVLVFKVDRLTRSIRDLVDLIDLFEQNKCAFNSLTESIDTNTPSGRMFLKIIGIFAEFERENISERTRLGKERKVKEGYTIAGYSISYGYVKEKGQNIQVIQSDEAKIVREVFEMYTEKNMSMGRIAKSLNERKIPTKRNAKTWDTNTIKVMLTNPTYIGKVRMFITDKDNYFEADGHHERILADEVFYLAQEKIKNIPIYSKTKKPREENYFCGVLVCALCGGKFTTHNQVCKTSEDPKKIRNGSYRCVNKQYLNSDISCSSPQISHAKMELAFEEYIKIVSDFADIDDLSIDNDIEKKKLELDEYIAICEKKMVDITERKKSIMQQYVSGETVFEEYKSLLHMVNERYDATEQELSQAKAELAALDNKPNLSNDDIIVNLKENWDYLNNGERMAFLQRFVKKIIVRIEKVQKRSCIAKIEEVDFNPAIMLPENAKNPIRVSLNEVRIR